LFKHCDRWKDRQAETWARVKEATKRGKQKWRVGDLLVDERCRPAVLDFLRSTYVWQAAPPVEENWDSEGGGGSGGRDGGACGVVTHGPLARNSSLCTFLCLATISLVISVVLYISFVTYFYGGGGEAGLLLLSPTFGAGRQTGNGVPPLSR